MRKNNLSKIIFMAIILLIVIAIIIVSNILENKNKPAEYRYTEEQAQQFYSKKLINYLDFFQTEMNMEYKVINKDKDGKLVESEEIYTKTSEIEAVYIPKKFVRMLITDEFYYYVDENLNMVYKYDMVDDFFINMSVLPRTLEEINSNYLTDGKETYKDVNYYYEQYKINNNDNIRANYYFDEFDNLKLIKIINVEKNSETICEINSLIKGATSDLLDLESSYETINMTS